jgi:hypothetical protein
MNIHVQQVGIVKQSIDAVWSVFRPFGSDIMKWWSIYDYVELESPGKDEVGAVRRFKTSGRTYQERLITRDDEKHIEQYQFMSVSPKAPGIRHIVTTITMEPVSEGTKVTWGSVSDIAWYLALPTYFIQHRAYKSAINDLSAYFKQPSLETTQV